MTNAPLSLSPSSEDSGSAPHSPEGSSSPREVAVAGIPSAAGLLLASALGSILGGFLILIGYMGYVGPEDSVESGSEVWFLCWGAVLLLTSAIMFLLAVLRLARQVYAIYLSVVPQRA